MAPRNTQAAALAADERTERDYQLDVNTAVANTEVEIFTDAMGDDELDNDGDTSLEEMDDGLEGNTEAGDQTEGDEGDEQLEAAEGDEGDEPEGDADDLEQIDDGTDQGDQGQRRGEQRQPERHEIRRPGVPPAVHRDVRHQARENLRRAETAEERADRIERELAEARGQIQVLTQMAPRQQPQQRQEQRPDPEPDVIVDPQGWREWNDRRTQERIQAGVREGIGAFRQEMQQRDEGRINQSFGELAQGPRRSEFNAAHQTLLTLDPRNPQNQATVRRIVNSPDPGAALMDWFEDNGAEEWRAEVAEQLGLGDLYEQSRQQQQSRQRGGNGNRQNGRQNGGRQQQSRQEQGQPRQVYRVPRSLSDAGGGRGGNSRDGAGTNFDPDAMDDSDESVFRSAMR